MRLFCCVIISTCRQYNVMNKLPSDRDGSEVIMSEMSDKYTKALQSTHYIERGEDYILPDSYPDVKSIVSCKARLADTKSYFGSNDTEITAVLIYNILFTATDNDGKVIMCSVSFKDEIKENLKYKSDNNTGVYLQCELSQCNYRMANPRKFSIKTTLKANVFEEVEENLYPSIETELPADANMQYFIEEADALRVSSVTLSEHSFSDNIELDAKNPEINELVHWNAELLIRNEKRSDATDLPIKLKAVFAIMTVYTDKEGRYRSFNREIPFSISFNDDEAAMMADKDGYSFIYPSPRISAMNLNIGKNQYGENKVLEFDADYDIEILLLGNKKVSVVTDAYSTKYSCVANSTKTKFLSVDGLYNANITCSGICDSPGNIETTACFDALTHVEEINAVNNNKLTGKVRTKAVLAGDDGSIDLREIQTPFSCNANGFVDSEILGNAATLGSKLRYDGEKLYSDSEVYFNFSSLVGKDITVCRSISSYSYDANNSKPAFSVYYQPREESLWNIAKLKKTTVDAIKSSNPDFDSRYTNSLIIE